MATQEFRGLKTSADHDTLSPRHIFVLLRNTGDGDELVRKLFAPEGQLGRLFARQFELALRIALADLGLTGAEYLHQDIVDSAQYSISSFLARDCARAFKDRGDSAFAGYLYILALRNIKWACLRHARRTNSKRSPRQYNFDLKEICDESIPIGLFDDAVAEALRAIREMEVPLRTVMHHYLEGTDISVTAAVIGVETKEYVRALRRRGIALVREALRENALWLLKDAS